MELKSLKIFIQNRSTLLIAMTDSRDWLKFKQNAISQSFYYFIFANEASFHVYISFNLYLSSEYKCSHCKLNWFPTINNNRISCLNESSHFFIRQFFMNGLNSLEMMVAIDK